MSRKIALRSLKNLCTFIGAIALFSYFANFAVDLRHWYFTLASAFVCSILWLGFYVIELRGGVMQVVFSLSHLRTKSEKLSPDANPLADDSDPVKSQEVTSPNPLPLLNPHPSQTR